MATQRVWKIICEKENGLVFKGIKNPNFDWRKSCLLMYRIQRIETKKQSLNKRQSKITSDISTIDTTLKISNTLSAATLIVVGSAIYLKGIFLLLNRFPPSPAEIEFFQKHGRSDEWYSNCD